MLVRLGPYQLPTTLRKIKMMSEEENRAEKEHWDNVMRTFLFYEDFVKIDLKNRINHVSKLPAETTKYLPKSYFEKISKIRSCARANQDFFTALVEFQDFGFSERISPPPNKNVGPLIPYSQMHRNQAVLHSLVREWSVEGEEERQLSFFPIINELKAQLPVDPANPFQYRVLVPGCGLARLPIEIASLGYCCQANEFSMFMLTASHFILNGVYQANAFQIYPWIDKCVR